MKRFKLIPVVAASALGLILVGGVAVMADPSDSSSTAQVSKETPAPKAKDDAKKDRARTPGIAGLGGPAGFSQDPGQLAALIDKLPEAMRTDLAEVLTAPKAERAKLIEDMIAKAKAGDYGEDVAKQLNQAEKLSKQFGEKAKKQWSDMPPALKKDLEELRGLDREKRADAMKKIAEDAKAGKYGDDVKKQYENFRGFAHKAPRGDKAAASFLS